MKMNLKPICKILLLVSFSLILCSFSKNKTKTITGYLQVYGNEPFTYLGIETIDKKQYAIKASKEEISKLWDSQGNLIEMTGIIIPSNNQRLPDMLKDGKIEVVEWKIVK